MTGGVTEIPYPKNPNQKKILRALLQSLAGETCWICRIDPATVIDHDHETGLVRGLLCNGCNVGLGFFRDRPGALSRAAEYVSGTITLSLVQSPDEGVSKS